MICPHCSNELSWNSIVHQFWCVICDEWFTPGRPNKKQKEDK
jgi:hypothetical protein